MSVNETKTLVIITPGFAADENDTTCLPAHQAFVLSLNKVYPSLKIIILSLQYPIRTRHYQWYGNTVIPLNGKNIPNILRPFLWLRIYKQLCQIPQHHILGILSFWCLDGAFVGSYFSKRKRLRHLCWITGQDARKGNPFVFMIRPKPGDLVAMSDFLADEFERNYSIRPKCVVPNGVNPEVFQNSVVEKSIDFLAAGSLIRLKQYAIVIDVIAELIKIKPSLRAFLCGAGPEEEMLKRKVTTLNLANNIFFKGELPHAQVLKLMQQAKIFLHPSSFEGYSTVCLEALYAGCHVVSFVAPEKRTINHWHIVLSKEEMISVCAALLQNEKNYSSELVHHMDDCAKKMMKLFSYNEDITS